MGQIQAPEFGLRLSKLFQMAGEIQALRSIEEVVFPVVTIADISKEAARGRLFSCYMNQPLNVANGTRVALVNPAGSGVNVRPSVFACRATAVSFAVGQLEPSAGAIAFLGVSEGDGGLANGAAGVQGSTPAGVAAANGVYLISVGTTVPNGVLDLTGLLLPPGRSLAMYSSIVNVTFDFMFGWSEENIA